MEAFQSRSPESYCVMPLVLQKQKCLDISWTPTRCKSQGRCCFVFPGAYEVQVHVEGYSFSLIVREKEVPDKLEQVQQQVGELSCCTKHVLARKTIPQEMICSMLQSQAQLEEKTKAATPEYLEQVWQEGNLSENTQNQAGRGALGAVGWSCQECVEGHGPAGWLGVEGAPEIT